MNVVWQRLAEREARGKPIRVALVGAGFMAQGIINQITHSVPGMAVAAVVARRPDQAAGALVYAGIDDVDRVSSSAELDAAVARGVAAVTDDASVVCASDRVDVVIEVTGSLHHAAGVVLDALAGAKHVVMMNAEVDGTIGPRLLQAARQHEVILTACDGDQPGVQANLVDFVRAIGVTPLVVGNIKGLQDTERNPTTQQGFAERWGQNVHMVTSFADGTKISFEQALVANAYGLTIERRGMVGADWAGHIDDATSLYDVDRLRELGGVVDYVVGAQPSPGVYCFGAHDDPRQRHYLDLYKLGTGPLYSFYLPYHLCHFEVPITVARAVELGETLLAPWEGPHVDVVATAKTDLFAGTELDGIGGYHTYGQAERHDLTRRDRLVPMGLAGGCRLRRDVAKGAVLTYDDVDVPEGRLADRLRAEQDEAFPL